MQKQIIKQKNVTVFTLLVKDQLDQQKYSWDKGVNQSKLVCSSEMWINTCDHYNTMYTIVYAFHKKQQDRKQKSPNKRINSKYYTNNYYLLSKGSTITM